MQLYHTHHVEVYICVQIEVSLQCRVLSSHKIGIDTVCSQVQPGCTPEQQSLSLETIQDIVTTHSMCIICPGDQLFNRLHSVDHRHTVSDWSAATYIYSYEVPQFLSLCTDHHQTGSAASKHHHGYCR